MHDDSIADLDVFLENQKLFKIMRNYPIDMVYNFLKESVEWEKTTH